MSQLEKKFEKVNCSHASVHHASLTKCTSTKFSSLPEVQNLFSFHLHHLSLYMCSISVLKRYACFFFPNLDLTWFDLANFICHTCHCVLWNLMLVVNAGHSRILQWGQEILTISLRTVNFYSLLGGGYSDHCFSLHADSWQFIRFLI